ncbi:hypothetical protein EVA_16595 [gut metagenome]|uniref:Uncharacterized protein n=1 Tax=gut metagenome TaxID=749906 RepID=J9G716_9ZZZZ
MLSVRACESISTKLSTITLSWFWARLGIMPSSFSPY